MTQPIRHPTATYRGAITTPERWRTWTPRAGDILVVTPPKSGTTWTQTMLAMLLHGGPDLPKPLGAISPWVDADLGVSAAEVAREIDALPGRRVVKTHTPADGFTIWKEVYVVAVYRHPLDLFFSLRKHIDNRHVGDDHPMKAPVSEALATFLHAPMDPNDFDSDMLEAVTHHYLQTRCAGHVPGLIALHYNDMSRDPLGTLRKLASATQIEVSDAQISAIVDATDINAMRAKADQFAPVGGTGFWKKDAAFFATGGTGNWSGQITQAEFEDYCQRLEALIPDADQRQWLEFGENGP